MEATRRKHVDSERAHRYWLEYQRTHDVSEWLGHAVGIDPESGRMWFGRNAIDVVRKRDADGVHAPLFLERVGYPTYCRKGGRR